MGRTERSFKGCETANAILRSFSKLSVGEGGGRGSRGTKEQRDSPLFLGDGVVDRDGGVEANREDLYPSAGWNAIGRLARGAGGSCVVVGVEGGNGEGTPRSSRRRGLRGQ